MSPVWTILVSIGQWAQTHQVLALSCAGAIIAGCALGEVAVWLVTRRRRGIRL